MICNFWGGPHDGATLEIPDERLAENDNQVFFEAPLGSLVVDERDPDEEILVQRGIYELENEDGNRLVWRGWE